MDVKTSALGVIGDRAEQLIKEAYIY